MNHGVARGDSRGAELFGGAVAGAEWDFVSSDATRIVIRDVGSARGRCSVTNDAERVVRQVVESFNLGARRLFYFDSDGRCDELLVRDGIFAGFAPGGDVTHASLSAESSGGV